MDGVKLTVEEDAMREIAHEAVIRKTGARGLRAIMEKTMINAMYNVPSDDTITEVIITKESVDGKAEPDYVRGKKPSKDGKRILRQKEPKGKISEI